MIGGRIGAFDGTVERANGRYHLTVPMRCPALAGGAHHAEEWEYVQASRGPQSSYTSQRQNFCPPRRLFKVFTCCRKKRVQSSLVHFTVKQTYRPSRMSRETLRKLSSSGPKLARKKAAIASGVRAFATGPCRVLTCALGIKSPLSTSVPLRLPLKKRQKYTPSRTFVVPVFPSVPI